MNSLSLLKCFIVDLGSAYYTYAQTLFTSIYVIKTYLICLAFAYIYKVSLQMVIMGEGGKIKM